jgi:hypothetical protein
LVLNFSKVLKSGKRKGRQISPARVKGLIKGKNSFIEYKLGKNQV